MLLGFLERQEHGELRASSTLLAHNILSYCLIQLQRELPPLVCPFFPT
jgi:hypothetical protein